MIFGFLVAGSSTVDFATQSTVCSWMAPGVNGSAAVGVSGCLLLHCDLEEEQMGNSDFADAKHTIEEYLKNMNMKEVDFFMEKFLPAYSMTLDESVTRLEG